MILNIYKEKGWTSFDVVAKLRSVLVVPKIGHAGTLDPLAEGVLIVLTEKDTKKQEKFMKMEKEYMAEIAFGATSPSFDLERALEFTDKPLDKKKLEETLQNYKGEIQQQVPAYSAVKVGGKPLYKTAHKEKVDESILPIRTVTINDIELLDITEKEFEGNLLPVAKIRITCSKGFYVRSLANDLGKDLGCGGVLVGLVRTKVGPHRLDESKKIADFK